MNIPFRKHCAALAAAFGLLAAGGAQARESAFIIPPPAVDPSKDPALQEKAVIAGGCFWGVQAVFQHVKGVTNAVSGYAGGKAGMANYDAVSSGRTGHAEAVEITYDPKQISYGQLLQIYFSVAHDPTELNRQGPDSGPQYRSTVFAQNGEQERVAKAYIAQLDQAKAFGKPIATTIEVGKPFYLAEDYHQNYLTLHPGQPYIMINDLPKIDDLKKLFPENYTAKPALFPTGKTS